MKTLSTVVQNLSTKKENALKELIWNKEQYLDAPLGEGMNFLDSYYAWCGVHTMYSEHLFRFHLNNQTNKNSGFKRGISKPVVQNFDSLDEFLNSL